MNLLDISAPSTANRDIIRNVNSENHVLNDEIPVNLKCKI